MQSYRTDEADPIVTQVTSTCLGPRPVLRFISGNTALPPTPDSPPSSQPTHNDADFDHLPIPFALVVNILLVTMTPENGSTGTFSPPHRSFHPLPKLSSPPSLLVNTHPSNRIQRSGSVPTLPQPWRTKRARTATAPAGASSPACWRRGVPCARPASPSSKRAASSSATCACGTVGSRISQRSRGSCLR